MSPIPLADIYYKIEDKWFDLLDWLEAHGIPVYKIIDPLEKRGIPSLPVFVALFLILIYAIFALLSGGGGFSLCVKDTGNKAVADAGLTVFSGSSAMSSGTTGSDGCYRSALSTGGYTVKISKATCDSNPHGFNVSDPGGSATVTVACGANLAKSFCVYPADAGDVKVTVRDSDGYLKSGPFKCGTGSCAVSIEPNMEYTFSAEGYSPKMYTYSQLNSMTTGQCIQLGEEGAEKGTFTVTVVDVSDKAIEDANVQLVDPDDNDTEVVNHQLTNEQGKAIFEGEVGKEFRVQVTPPSSMSLATYLSDETDSFTFAAGYRNVKLTGASSALYLIVKNSSSDALMGVRVTVFSEYGSDVKYTNTSGGVVFGVDGGKTYRVALFKPEYKYTEISMKSGNSKTVTLEKIRQQQVGTIQVTVMRSDGVSIKDVTLTIYSSDGKDEKGYPIQKTDDRGSATFTGVEPGKYCVIASRGGNQSSCTDGQVEVTANKLSTLTITLEPLKYEIAVEVTANDGRPAYNADVSVVELQGTTPERKKTNYDGVAVFKMTEGKRYSVEVLYTDVDGEKFKAQKMTDILKQNIDVPITLVSLDTKLTLVGIFSKQNEDYTNLPLQSGRTYNFRFNLGLPDVTGKRWDSIETEFKFIDTNYISFDAGLLLKLDPDGMLSLEMVTDSNDQKKMKISGSYNPHDTVIVWDVSATVKDSFDGTHDTAINYNGKWTSGTLVKTDPLSGTSRKTFTVTKSASQSTPSFSILATCKNETGEYPCDWNAFTMPIHSTFNITLNITNLNDTAFSGKIRILQDTRMLNFLDADAGKYGRPDVRYENITLTIPVAAALKKDEQVGIEIKAEAISTNIGTGLIYLLSQNPNKPDSTFTFFIQGQGDAWVNITKPSTAYLTKKINEFTTSMGLHVQDKVTKKTVGFNEIKSIVMDSTSTPSALAHPCVYGREYGTWHIKEIEGSAGDFNVDFITDCPVIGPGQIGIEITAESPDYAIEPLTINVVECLQDDGTNKFQTEVSKPYSDSVQVQTGCSESHIQYEDSKMWAEYPQGSTMTLGTATKTDAQFTVPFTFTYSAFISGDSIVVTPSINFTAYSEENLIRKSKNKSIVLEATVTKKTDTGGGAVISTAPFFKPLPIQRYGEGSDCSNNFCSIDQALDMLIGQIECDYNSASSNDMTLNSVDQDLTAATMATIAKALSSYNGLFGSKIYSDRYTLELTSFTGKALIINGSVGIGENSVTIEKSGGATSCYTKLNFEHLSVPSTDKTIKLIQLYTPVSETAGSAITNTYYESSKAGVPTLLNSALAAEWGLDSYTNPSIADHKMYGRVDDNLGVPARISYDSNSNKIINFVADSESNLNLLVKSYRAYMNPNDAYYICPTPCSDTANGDAEFLVTDENSLIFGPNRFYLNYSTGDVNSYSGLTSSLVNLIKRQLSVHPSAQIVAQNGPAVSSFAVVALGDSASLPSWYKDKFASLFGSAYGIPDKGIGRFDEGGNNIFAVTGAGSDAVAKNVADAFSGGTTAGYQRIGDSLAAQYSTMTMEETGTFITNKFANDIPLNHNYSTIIKTTQGTGNCRVDLSGSGISITIDVGGSFRNDGIYLVTMQNTTAGKKVNAKTLWLGASAAGTTVCGGTTPQPSILCGNYVIDSGETCDGTNLGTCQFACNISTVGGCKCSGDRRELDLAILYNTGNNPWVMTYNYNDIKNNPNLNSDPDFEMNVSDKSNHQIMKLADINNDDRAELILFSPDEGKLSVLNYNGESGTKYTIPPNGYGWVNWGSEKTITFTKAELNFVDLAVIDWNKDGKLDLIMLSKDNSGNNKIYIYNYSSITSGATIGSGWVTPAGNKQPTVLTIPANSFNRIAGVDIANNGNPALAVTRVEEAYYCYFALFPANAVDAPIDSGQHDWTGTGNHTNYAFFDPASDEHCHAFGFIDWNKDGKKDVVMLTQDKGGTGWNSHNDIFVYDINAIKNDGAMVTLTRDAATSQAWVNAKDLGAENLYVADVNGDGADEIIQSDLTGDGNDLEIYALPLSLAFNAKYDDAAVTGWNPIKVTFSYKFKDLVAYDWENNWPPMRTA